VRSYDIRREFLKRYLAFRNTSSSEEEDPEPFNFAALPRELRDNIYSYLVGLNATLDSTEYQFGTSQYRYQKRGLEQRDVSPEPYISRAQKLPTVNHMMHDEALDTLYRDNSFTVVVDSSFPVLAVHERFTMHGTEVALPYGWDLSRVQNLTLRIDMGDERSIDGAKLAFDFGGSARMKSLKKFRLMVTIWPLYIGRTS
jgi:hypothetical protein